MNQRELKRLIARGPQPDMVDTTLWAKNKRDLAWWTALKKCGLFRVDGLSFHVSVQPFFVPTDPIWKEVGITFRRELAKLSVMPSAQLHSTTSKAAAESIRMEVGHIRQQVYNLLINTPSTDSEVAVLLDKSENTTRPRRIELVELGLVHAVGQRFNKSGRKAQIWAAIEERKL